MKEKICKIVFILIVIVLAGCDHQKPNTREQFYMHINQNTLLNEDERIFAKRFYDAVNSEIYDYCFKRIEETDIVINSDALNSEFYNKWGPGKRRGFSQEEKGYLKYLSGMVKMWESYNSIDMTNLTNLEKQYLNEVHEEYGEGPLSLERIYLIEMQKQYDEVPLFAVEEALKDTNSVDNQLNCLLEIITGCKGLYDKDLLFFHMYGE